MKKRISLFLLIFSFISVMFPLKTSAISEQTIKEPAPDVKFSFSVLDYKYAMTVTNNTDLDIVKIQSFDSHFMEDVEKGGASSYRCLPYAITTEPLVASGATETIDIVTLIWHDCTKLVTYVYYIEFSDGSHWGIDLDTVSSLTTYAQKFEVPYEFTPPKETISPFGNFQESQRVIDDDFIFGCIILLVIIIVCVFVLKHKKAKNGEAQKSTPIQSKLSKGQIGEYLAYDKLDSITGEKRLLHNLYIKKPSGETTEIDCLLIHQKGLFVIESKNYKGYIYGSPDDKTWTQVLRKNRHFTFYNPVRQNYGHIKNMMTYLSYVTQDKYRKVPVYSIVAFTSTADITNVKTEGLSSNTRIIYTEKITEIIIEIVNSTEESILSEEDVDHIYEALRPCAEASDAEKNNHIEVITNKTIQ